LFLILYASWVAKIWLFPQPAVSLDEFIQRSSVGPISGQVMILLGFGLYGFLTVVALATISMTRATGEVLPRFGEDTLTSIFSPEGKIKGLHAFLAPRHHRKQLMALIITGNPEAVSKRIISELGRGVTALTGKGMYTGQERSVLICALTVTEVHNLKFAVNKEDPNAFVVVSAAQEILGRGFNPLAEEKPGSQ
jgi:hypothetical protein